MSHPALDLLTPTERRIVGTALDVLLGSWGPRWDAHLIRHYRRVNGVDARAARRLLAQLSPGPRPTARPDPAALTLELSQADRRVLIACLQKCDSSPADRQRASALLEHLGASPPVA